MKMLNKKLTFSSVFSARAVAALYSASSWSARASAFSVSVWRKGAHLSQFKVQGVWGVGGINLYAITKRPEVKTTLDLDILLVLLLVLAIF